MSNVNALVSPNVGNATTGTGNHTCGNCTSDAPSFASVLEMVQGEGALLATQQKHGTDDPASRQAEPAIDANSLSASVLITLAANDTLAADEQQDVIDPEAEGEAAFLTNNILAETPDTQSADGAEVPPASSEEAVLTVADQAPANTQPVANALDISLLGDNAAPVPANTTDGENISLANAAENRQPEERITSGPATPTKSDNAPALPTPAPATNTLAGTNEFVPLVEAATEKGSAGAPIQQPAMANAEPKGAHIETAAASTQAGKTVLNGLNTKIEPTDARTPGTSELSSATVEGEGPDLPSASKGDGSGAQNNDGQRPASLMQRLKPMQQAAPLFQFQDNMVQGAGQTADLAAMAPGTVPAGDMVARPAGIDGLGASASTPTTPSVPLNNIAVHIASQARAGNQKFNIRLDPPELGRIDIRLEIGRDGQTLTHMAVEKPETLELLRQDSKALERALQNAGLDAGRGNLSFSLRENNSEASGSDGDDDPTSTEANAEENSPEAPIIERVMNVTSGLDIRI